MSVRTVMIAAAATALFAVAAQASERDHAFVLLKGGSHSVAMSGSSDDVRRARALRSGDESLLFVRRGDAEYVVRDPATLRQVKALFEPQEALGREQAELGARQAALGREQARLGAQQAALAYRRIGDSPREAAESARRQAELGREQAALGRQQGALGREQGELGRRQGELGRAADRQMRTMVDEAIRSGLAQRVD